MQPELLEEWGQLWPGGGNERSALMVTCVVVVVGHNLCHVGRGCWGGDNRVDLDVCLDNDVGVDFDGDIDDGDLGCWDGVDGEVDVDYTDQVVMIIIIFSKMFYTLLEFPWTNDHKYSLGIAISHTILKGTIKSYYILVLFVERLFVNLTAHSYICIKCNQGGCVLTNQVFEQHEIAKAEESKLWMSLTQRHVWSRTGLGIRSEVLVFDGSTRVA